MYKIKFKGEDFLLIGSPENGGAIATQEQWDRFAPSFAHLYPSGRVLQHGEEIGTKDDIEWGEKLAETPSPFQYLRDAFAELDKEWGLNNG